jgi:dethiobiotin synthase
MLLSPAGLLSEARDLCTKHGVLLIADEVATGFGRTGKMFACEHEQVTPDLMTVAKGLTGGYLPVAATLATQEVFSEFLGTDQERLTFFHGHSYGGNPLGCAAALASLGLFEKDKVLPNLASKIEHLSSALTEKVSHLPAVAEIRQKGLMVGIELSPHTPSQDKPDDTIGAQVCRQARRHGVILRPLGNVIVLMPPLSITHDEITLLVSATAAAIGETIRGVSPITYPTPSRTANTLPSPRGLFLLATDTGVGKTTVATGLITIARTRGLRPIPFKPVETGASPLPSDALALRAASGREDLPLESICPYSFSAPVAPALAANKAGLELTAPLLLEAFRKVSNQGDLPIVESAGGILTPYSETLSGADLAAAFGLPVLLISRNALGTINHTALALREIARRRLQLAGVILVSTSSRATPDQDDNARLLKAVTGITPLGVIPFLPAPTPEQIADALLPILPPRIFSL